MTSCAATARRRATTNGHGHTVGWLPTDPDSSLRLMAYNAHGSYLLGSTSATGGYGKQQKTLSSHLGRKGNMPSVVPPTFHMAYAMRHVLHRWPLTDALRDSLPPAKAGRRRANGWYSPSSFPEMALSRWPSVAVGRRQLLVPLRVISICATFSISRRPRAVKPVQ